MISIQELGLTIMSDSPKQLYIVGGSEYGVKDKYIDALIKLYGNKEEHESMSSLIDFLSVKHIVPLKPTLYIVRYDENFVSSVNTQLVQKINSLKFKGTIFCIYSEPKHIEKLNKFFPDNTGVIEPVNIKFVEKYLHSDFPNINPRYIQIASKAATSYGHARILCKSMMKCDERLLSAMSDKAIAKSFGCETLASESDFQKAIASRNFNICCKLVETYEGNLDNIVYTILQTMIEMEKVLTSKYSTSELKDYGKLWKLEDVYNMFMNAYSELEKLRSNTSTDISSSLIYLFGLFTFKDIPSVEVMSSDS